MVPVKRWVWGILVVMAVLGGFGAVSVAYAHAELLEASPPVGAQWRWTRPSEIRLTFTQEIDVTQSAVTLINRQFQQQNIGVLQQEPNDKTTIFVPVPTELTPGTYTVNWNTRSVDGHSIQGSYDFTLFPRESVITAVVAPIVLIALGIFVWTRRAT